MDKPLEQAIQEAAQRDRVVAILLHQRDEARLRVNLQARATGAGHVYPVTERYLELWRALERELVPQHGQ